MTGLLAVAAWPVVLTTLLVVGDAIGLDWRRHQVASRFSRSGRCTICDRPALMRDEAGRPCHKVCAERDRGYEA